MPQALIALFLALTAFGGRADAAEIYSQKHPSGWTWIFIVGKIELGDDKRFKDVLLENARKHVMISSVALYSPGGAVEPALRIGRYIHTMRIATIGPYSFKPILNIVNCPYNNGKLARYDLKTGRGDPSCTCASACFLIWAAGLGADAHNDNVQPRIQIHRIAFDRQIYANLSVEQAQAKYESAEARLVAYLKDMDVPPSVIRRMFSIPSSSISYLTVDELKMMRGALPPYLAELYDAKCGKNQKCRDDFEERLYFETVPKLEEMN